MDFRDWMLLAAFIAGPIVGAAMSYGVLRTVVNRLQEDMQGLGRDVRDMGGKISAALVTDASTAAALAELHARTETANAEVEKLRRDHHELVSKHAALKVHMGYLRQKLKLDYPSDSNM
jgi:cell division protein FtsB